MAIDVASVLEQYKSKYPKLRADVFPGRVESTCCVLMWRYNQGAIPAGADFDELMYTYWNGYFTHYPNGVDDNTSFLLYRKGDAGQKIVREFEQEYRGDRGTDERVFTLEVIRLISRSDSEICKKVNEDLDDVTSRYAATTEMLKWEEEERAEQEREERAEQERQARAKQRRQARPGLLKWEEEEEEEEWQEQERRRRSETLIKERAARENLAVGNKLPSKIGLEPEPSSAQLVMVLRSQELDAGASQQEPNEQSDQLKPNLYVEGGTAPCLNQGEFEGHKGTSSQ